MSRSLCRTPLFLRFRGLQGAARTLPCPILFFLLILVLPLPVHAQATGTIAGRVTVAEGRALPAGQEVELLFLPNAQGPPAISSQPLGADGGFRFEGVDPAPQHRYLVRVTVEGEETLSELLAFAPDQTALEVELRLLARTTDARALSLPEANFILDLRADGWLVAALYRFQNGGESIIVNPAAPPARIPLPAAATDVQFAEGFPFEGILELPDGFSFAGPFAPGETALVFSYRLPYQPGEQTVTLPLGVAAGRVRVLVPQLGQTIATDDLTALGAQEGFEGRTFEIFEALNPAATQTFTFRFANLPPAPTPAPDDLVPDGSAPPRVAPLSPLERLPRWAALVPMALAALLAIGYSLSRPAPTPAEQRAALRDRRAALVAEIAALDGRFESGTIGEQSHQRQRAALKRELRTLLQQLGTPAEENA